MYPEKGPRGRLVCLSVVCPLVYPEKGPRGRLVCFYVVCPLVYPEKGPRGRLVCLLCSLPPEKAPMFGEEYPRRATSAILFFFHPCSPCLDTIVQSYSINVFFVVVVVVVVVFSLFSLFFICSYDYIHIQSAVLLTIIVLG